MAEIVTFTTDRRGTWIPKAAGAAKDYTINAEKRFPGDPIISADWAVPAAITKANFINSGGKATATLGGGARGQEHTITVTLTFQSTRVEVVSFILRGI